MSYIQTLVLAASLIAVSVIANNAGVSAQSKPIAASVSAAGNGTAWMIDTDGAFWNCKDTIKPGCNRVVFGP